MDWKEIKMTWTIEESMRFAQLIAGESHLTEVNKDLIDELVSKGYKLIRSRGTRSRCRSISAALLRHRGQGHGALHGVRPHDAKLHRSSLDERQVRQAMNKAINRNELLKVLYKGRAQPMYVHAFDPDIEGWHPPGRSVSGDVRL